MLERDAQLLAATPAGATGGGKEAVEGVWIAGHPNEPGIYRVRGFHCGYPDDFAVVEVVRDNAELICNLHCENSNRDLGDWRLVADCNKAFQWQRIDAATPAGGGDDLASIIKDLRHSALVDDYEIQQIAFLESIADRLASAPARVGWQPIESLRCEDGPVLLYSPEWVDADFNPEGIREGFRNEGPGGPILSACWCNTHDIWETDERSAATHWRKRPAAPAQDPSR